MKFFAITLLITTHFCFGMQGDVVHEAYLTPVHGEITAEMLDQAPPAPQAEEEPSQKGTVGEEWIPGYWSWNDDEHEFVWVSGVWRKPPPGHRWVPGEWASFGESWMWLQGFWSTRVLSDLQPIPQAPPPVQEQEVLETSGDHLFWKSGYWKWDGKKYQWQKGSWESFEEDQVWIPPHYVWRPQGYLFVDGYWDWPIDQIGELDTDGVVEALFVDYPDYLPYYAHHYYYHRQWWDDWCCTPPWWAWSGWWALPWFQQWQVFWWWGHPSFHRPGWLHENWARRIPHANAAVRARLDGRRGARVVAHPATKRGVTHKAVTHPNFSRRSAARRPSGGHGGGGHGGGGHGGRR